MIKYELTTFRFKGQKKNNHYDKRRFSNLDHAIISSAGVRFFTITKLSLQGKKVLNAELIKFK